MESRRIHGGVMAALILLIVALPSATVGTAVQRVADYRWDDVERETWTRLSALQRTSLRRPKRRLPPQRPNRGPPSLPQLRRKRPRRSVPL